MGPTILRWLISPIDNGRALPIGFDDCSSGRHGLGFNSVCGPTPAYPRPIISKGAPYNLMGN